MVVSKETSYDVAYRISNKQGSMVGRIPHWENWLALALAIITERDSTQSLIALGINPQNKPRGVYSKSDIGNPKQYDDVVYFLNKCCGLQQLKCAKMLRLSSSSVNRAILRKRLRIE